MANNITFYKDIGVGEETTYGSSVAISDYIHDISYGVQENRNKERIEDTTNTAKGHDRIESRRIDLAGPINFFGTPRSLKHGFELVNGQVGISGATVGTSASRIDFNQTSGDSFISKTFYTDLNNLQEAHHGLRASSMEISIDDDLMNVTLELLGTEASVSGVTLTPSSETTKPFKFSNVNLIRAATLAGISAGVTISVNELTITYNNGLEGTHQSGSAVIKRSDPKIPTIEVTFSVFAESTFWQTAKQGCSTYAFRLDGEMDPCQGTINGSTPYRLTIDIPAAEIVMADINRENGQYISEDITLFGKYDSSNDFLWKPQMVMESL